MPFDLLFIIGVIMLVQLFELNKINKVIFSPYLKLKIKTLYKQKQIQD